MTARGTAPTGAYCVCGCLRDFHDALKWDCLRIFPDRTLENHRCPCRIYRPRTT